MFQNLLFPTDFSSASLRALKYATAMAKAFNANLHVLHVCDDPLLNAESTAEHFREEQRRKSEQQLEQLKGSDAELANAIVVSRSGPPYTEIIDYAKQAEIDAIVMGTHGRSGIAHAILGSVAEKVLRHAHIPVLAVPHPDNRGKEP